MFSEKTKKRAPKIPTKARLKNIALYYLKRFETSKDNLRTVLKRRVDKYAIFEKEFDKTIAYSFIDEIIEEFSEKNFVNDERFSEFKITSYLRSGKPKRYIEQKLKQKGISEQTTAQIFEEIEYNELDVALSFAKKKKIGPYRESEEKRLKYKQKDLATLIRAGFDFDVAKDVLDYTIENIT